MSDFQPARACPYKCRHPDVHLPDGRCIRARHKFNWKAALVPINADIIPVGNLRESFDPEREMTAGIQRYEILPPVYAVRRAAHSNMSSANGDIHCNTERVAEV